MGKFKKGQSGNPGGRPKGKPNKTTEEIRGVFQSFVEINIENMQSIFDELEPKEKLHFIERMAKFVLPPLFSIKDTVVDMEREKARVAALFPTEEEFRAIQEDSLN